MARLFVEGWSPEYGSPIEPEEALAPSVGEIDCTIEVDGNWEPLPSRDDAVTPVAFVDGVRRVDARLTLDDPQAGPVAGICGSLGVGSTLWRRDEPRSVIGETIVERLAILGGGRQVSLPPVGTLDYRSESVPVDDPGELVRHFHGRMRSAEAELASRLAALGTFVVADGPVNELRPQPIVGYIKSHRVSYLPPEYGRTIGRLPAGHRTPLFTLSTRYPRYSWYVRLADVVGGHSWSGVVRLETPAAVGLETAAGLADRTAAILPLVASEGHIDPRAPQNLVPIAALERELRRRLGDAGLVYRALREAVDRREDVA